MMISAKEVTEMAEGELKMSRRERQRLLAMHEVQSGRSLLKEAAGQMRLSYRQTKRVWRRFRTRGAEGLVHEGRGRVSNRRLPEDIKARALAVYEKNYKGYGPTKAAEKLAQSFMNLRFTQKQETVGCGLPHHADTRTSRRNGAASRTLRSFSQVE